MIDKAKAIRKVIGAAKDYEEKLNNRHFLIVYREGQETKCSCVSFRDYHFLHFTGLKLTDKKVSNTYFYKLCLDERLSPGLIYIDNKGKVEQKLQVIPYLGNLLYNRCLVGNFINSGIHLTADYIVGDTRATLSLCIRFSESSGPDAPVSLLKEDVRKITKPTDKVLAIFSRRYNETNFTKCTFLSPELSLSDIKIPDEYVIEIQ